MASRNIRNSALSWFQSRNPGIVEGILCSKFYTPDESWSKSRVWFFQIPYNILDPNRIRYLHLLCENPSKGEAFHYLKVPVSFFLLNEKKFDVDEKQVMRIYLSAEAIDKFIEVRKGSKVDFKKYLQNDTSIPG